VEQKKLSSFLNGTATFELSFDVYLDRITSVTQLAGQLSILHLLGARYFLLEIGAKRYTRKNIGR
jgi:hypothetical protein